MPAWRGGGRGAACGVRGTNGGWPQWGYPPQPLPATTGTQTPPLPAPPSLASIPSVASVRPPPLPSQLRATFPQAVPKAGGSGRHGGHRRWPPHQATAPKSTAVQWAHAGNARWRCGIGGCARAVAPAASARGPQAFRRTAPPTHVPAEAAVGSAPPARPPAPNGASWVVRVVKPRSGRALTAPEKECGGSPR